MITSELTRTIGNLAATKREYDVSLRMLLVKWTGDNIFKTCDLPLLKSLASSGHGELLAWHISQMEAAAAGRLLKKLDPHASKSLAANRVTAASHIKELIAGQRLPAEKPQKPTRQRSAPMPFDQILKLSDENARRAELKKHKPADIKAAIKNHDIDLLMLPSKASKIEMIEHIEAAIMAGWPRPRGILHPSQS